MARDLHRDLLPGRITDRVGDGELEILIYREVWTLVGCVFGVAHGRDAERGGYCTQVGAQGASIASMVVLLRGASSTVIESCLGGRGDDLLLSWRAVEDSKEVWR